LEVLHHAFIFFWFKSPTEIGYFIPFSKTLIKAFFFNHFFKWKTQKGLFQASPGRIFKISTRGKYLADRMAICQKTT
jgi:hypothetical protein